MKLIRRAFLKSCLAGICTVLAISGWSTSQEKSSGSCAVRVLFIGNSYTYFNNVPEILTRMAESGRQQTVETRMVAPGGWRLKDHWEKGEALKALHESKWDYVVLQEQSTLGVNYFVEGRPRIAGDEIFRPYAKKWAAEVRKTGAIPLFYLTWARKATPEDQGALNYAYMRAARENRAQVAPVGIAWASVRRRQPSLELFYVDGSHPSPAGSYLAGCVLYSAIFRRSPAGLPGKISGVPVNLQTALAEPQKIAVLADLPPEQAQLLQAAAWEVWQQVEKNGGYFDVSPAPVPGIAPVPRDVPLAITSLEGMWAGNLLLYPPPLSPAEMTLQFHLEGKTWKGRLDLKFHSKDQRDTPLGLADLRITKTGISFSCTNAPQNLKIRFMGVSGEPGELRGTAEASPDNPNSAVRLVGSWLLHKESGPRNRSGIFPQRPAIVPCADRLWSWIWSLTGVDFFERMRTPPGQYARV
ncbi:MAG: SGNH/GDSL hydrolase family protein [Acidobacteriia bacterium]|nr:SGNH/GDSL hydrolase family protein [Terriglobia bacterium]